MHASMYIVRLRQTTHHHHQSDTSPSRSLNYALIAGSASGLVGDLQIVLFCG